ncbi:hypothetical protein MY04_4385 [Flammeovirga sp. MY04]|uniref:hypothetical protein n=1 Tax=Flammeovirga sp. MY04 TaxID=1191459 RepID=UPI0008062545|nr:hypothetical protein [Flammeovirga sp. MY04]ANQ51723.1 hypothetical protein MY04_4385 [Flammeovirga sp. MY04]
MKRTLTLFILILLSIFGFEVQAQIQVFGTDGLMDQPTTWGASSDVLKSFKGKEKVVHLKRNQIAYGGVLFDTYLTFDFSKSNTVSFEAYYPTPSKKLDEYTLMFGVRVKGDQGEHQVLHKFAVKSFDEWEKYTFTIDPDEGIDYQSVVLIMQPGSKNGEGDGLEMYLTNVEIPGILSDDIKVNITTNAEGNQILLQKYTSPNIVSKLKKPVFKVIKNGYKVLEIASVEADESQVKIHLKSTVGPNDDIKLSFEKGGIFDEKGHALKYFKYQEVKNVVPVTYDVYTDFGLGDKYLKGRYSGYRAQLLTVNDPKYQNGKVLQVKSTEQKSSAVLFQLTQPIDITKEKKFKLKVYVPSPKDGVDKVKLDLCFRQDQKADNQLVKQEVISRFDKWVELVYDFNGEQPEQKIYNSICISFNPDPMSEYNKQLSFYLKELQGPIKTIN